MVVRRPPALHSGPGGGALRAQPVAEVGTRLGVLAPPAALLDALAPPAAAPDALAPPVGARDGLAFSAGRRPAASGRSASLARSCSTALVWIWQTRLSVAAGTLQISA